jgi:hypothetical protein
LQEVVGIVEKVSSHAKKDYIVPIVLEIAVAFVNAYILPHLLFAMQSLADGRDRRQCIKVTIFNVWL